MAYVSPPSELELMTRSYFIADNGKAVDLFFYTSYWLTHFLKESKGLMERPDSGRYIEVFVEYKPQLAKFIDKTSTIPVSDVQSVTTALFLWKHAVGTAMVSGIDSLKNNGRLGEIKFSLQRMAGAQKGLTDLLAGSVYDDIGVDDSMRLTGLLAKTNTSTTQKYAGLVPSDADGQWVGRRYATTQAISTKLIRTLRTTSKVRDGKGGKADLFTMPEALFNVLEEELQLQKRYTQNDGAANAGFSSVMVNQAMCVADDYIPANTVHGTNTATTGFAVHSDGMFKRTPWRYVEGTPEDRMSAIYFHGNIITKQRKGDVTATAVQETASAVS